MTQKRKRKTTAHAPILFGALTAVGLVGGLAA
jgi:hypothetical protein